MTRGEEETSTSQAGRKRGLARGTRSASSIVSSLTMEELRAYYEIPNNIDLKLMEKPDEFTLGGEHNAVFFTQEQLRSGFVSQFLPSLNSSYVLPRHLRPLSIPILSRY